jgi:Uma2 family endonuclease
LPDISVHLTDAPIVKKGPVLAMPDFAVEVKSPTNTLKGLREKAAFYLEKGCQIVWLVNPEKRIVEVYTPDKDIEILLDSDIVDGGDVLPGFTLPVAALFP